MTNWRFCQDNQNISKSTGNWISSIGVVILIVGFARFIIQSDIFKPKDIKPFDIKPLDINPQR